MPHNPDVINSLRRLGLNQYEAKSYYALSTLGKSTAGDLAERALVARPRVYDVLRSLQDKGFVALRQGRPVQYVALPLTEAISTLKKHRYDALSQELAKMEEISGQLSTRMTSAPSMSESIGSEESVWMLKGRDAIYSKMGSMIDGARKQIMISTTQNVLARKLGEHAKLLEKARTRGVKINVVSQLDRAKLAEVSKLARVVPQSLPTRMVLADDQALVFLSKEDADPTEEVGLWLNSPHFSETLRQAVKE